MLQTIRSNVIGGKTPVIAASRSITLALHRPHPFSDICDVAAPSNESLKFPYQPASKLALIDQLLNPTRQPSQYESPQLSAFTTCTHVCNGPHVHAHIYGELKAPSPPASTHFGLRKSKSRVTERERERESEDTRHLFSSQLCVCFAGSTSASRSSCAVMNREKSHRMHGKWGDFLLTRALIRSPERICVHVCV